MFPRHKKDPDLDGYTTEATEARIRAQVELDRARQQTSRVKAQTPLYRDLGTRLRELRERNHFADSIAASFKGRAP